MNVLTTSLGPAVSGALSGGVLDGHQHLINAARGFYVNDAPSLEESWLDEGLSHTAEEFLFYAASGLQPHIGFENLRPLPRRRSYGAGCVALPH